jgi:hypothetical protein
MKLKISGGKPRLTLIYKRSETAGRDPPSIFILPIHLATGRSFQNHEFIIAAAQKKFPSLLKY